MPDQPPTGTTQTVTIRGIGPKDDGQHVIEVIDYHVKGWKRTRCLTHGEHGIARDMASDQITAASAARECRRVRLLPSAPHHAPLAPSLVAESAGAR
jgi:hypothetical protein